jgi:hypothetical protein
MTTNINEAQEVLGGTIVKDMNPPYEEEPQAGGPAMAPEEILAMVRSGRNIYQRMNAVQRRVRFAAKTRVNQHHKYKFIGHDDVTDAVRDAMVEEGIDQEVDVREVVREGSSLRVMAIITWRSVDDPTSFKTVSTHGESFSVNSKGTPDDVQYGKAVSYAVKTALLKNFMLVGDDTPDNERDHGRREEPARERVVERQDDSAEQLALDMVDQMRGCRTLAELDDIGKTLEPVVTRVSKKTRDLLNNEWMRAEDRLKSAGAGDEIPY